MQIRSYLNTFLRFFIFSTLIFTLIIYYPFIYVAQNLFTVPLSVASIFPIVAGLLFGGVWGSIMAIFYRGKRQFFVMSGMTSFGNLIGIFFEMNYVLETSKANTYIFSSSYIRNFFIGKISVRHTSDGCYIYGAKIYLKKFAEML